MEMNQYLDIFIEESKEHLQRMNESLLSLEKTNDDKELLNEIFRAAHTIKGMAGTMGYNKMSKLTHEMENLLHIIRSGKMHINTNIIDILFECFDATEDYLVSIEKNGQEGQNDNNILINKIKSAINGYENNINSMNNKIDKVNSDEIQDNYVLNVIEKAKKQGLNSYRISVILKEKCMLKSARAFIVFKTLEKHSEIIKSIPSVEDIEDEKFEKSFEIIAISNSNEEKIRKEIMLISEIEDVEIIKIQVKDEISCTSIEIEKNEKKIIEQNDNIDDSSKTNKKNNKKSKKIGKTVRVDIDRLDNLMNLVSELIIIKTRMEDINDNNRRQNMDEAIEYLQRITSNLHDSVMKVRMVPIERVFNRFPRMVRDLSKELGKKIDLKMSGEDTEVDRTIIDEIGDPLIHIIRNSIDHGIEHPNERIELGKNEIGTVNLQAYADGNNVLIDINDDGKGIDLDNVKRKAIQKNLVTEERALQMNEDDVINLLFKPGFSTAAKVTDVSGRGVGLDVVKSKIESLGGTVEVKTKQGIGSRFIIRLPLTLAIIQGLLIKVDEEIYAIPLGSIKEITPIMKKEIRKVQGQEVVLFRNKTLPIIRLKGLIGLEDKNDNEELITVIVKKGEKEAMLIVDDLIGQQEIVIKSLGKYLSGARYIAGATILGNGRISLILDVNSLF